MILTKNVYWNLLNKQKTSQIYNGETKEIYQVKISTCSWKTKTILNMVYATQQKHIWHIVCCRISHLI